MKWYYNSALNRYTVQYRGHSLIVWQISGSSRRLVSHLPTDDCPDCKQNKYTITVVPDRVISSLFKAQYKDLYEYWHDALRECSFLIEGVVDETTIKRSGCIGWIDDIADTLQIKLFKFAWSKEEEDLLASISNTLDQD